MEGTRVWCAVLVPSGSTNAFSRDAWALVDRYKKSWAVDGLHWADIMSSRGDLRERVLLEDVVTLANELNGLIQRHAVAILMHSIAPEVVDSDEERLEALRQIGLRTGNSSDDVAFTGLLSEINDYVAAGRRTPTDRVLVFTNTRGGKKWSRPEAAFGGPWVERLWPMFAGRSIYLAPRTWPELQVADYAAYTYNSVISRAALGETGGIYRDLFEVFAQLSPLRTSPEMEFGVLAVRETGEASRRIELIGEMSGPTQECCE
jgi:hypothetical protein